MRQKSIEVKGLSHHGAPIPTACRVGPILVTSRIMGKDPETGILPPDPDAQAVLCFENLKRVLAAGGMDLGDVVKLTVYLVSDSYRTRSTSRGMSIFPTRNTGRHAIRWSCRCGAEI